MLEFRKHLGWYVKGIPASAELRKKLHAVNSLDEVEGIFDEYLRLRETFGSDIVSSDTGSDMTDADSIESAA